MSPLWIAAGANWATVFLVHFAFGGGWFLAFVAGILIGLAVYLAMGGSDGASSK